MTDPHNSDIEARLRAALHNRASTVRPSTDGLSRIEEKLMRTSSLSPGRKWAIGALSVAAAVLVAVLVATNLGDGGDDTDVVTDDTTSSTTETTPTTERTTTTAAEPEPAEVDPYAVAYPTPGSQTFDNPDDAAHRYASDVLGFTRMVIGEFQAGDSRSGEVVVSDREDGRETVVLLRQMDDDAWYVLGSITPDIEVDTPETGATVASPFETTGSALAFEGHVDVSVLTQADLAEAGTGFVTGSGVPPAGPFSGEITFTAPDEDTPGILIYRTLSAEDGHVEMATSFPVRLAADIGS